MRTFCFLFVTLVFVSASPAAFAESLSDKIQKKYSIVSTMDSEFTQKITHKESGSIKDRKGTLIFKKPMLVRWETTFPSPELIIVNKNDLWDIFSDEQLAYKYPANMVEASTNIIRVITGQSRLDQDFSVEEQGNDGSLAKLIIYPNEPTQSLVEATLWIDPTTAVIKKLVIVDFYGNTNEVSFVKQSVGVAIDDKVFQYIPPKSYTVENRSEKEGGQVGS